MIIKIDTQKMQDPNEFGETLRKYCFKEEYGCYSCFELIDGFEKITTNSLLGYDLFIIFSEDFYDLKEEDVTIYSNGNIDIVWFWDGDGVLMIREDDKIAINGDCKKSNRWEWV